MDISVILPVVNERENLPALVARLKTILERDRLTYEIIVVDGNSTDGTAEAAESMGARVVSEGTHPVTRVPL
jgi:glycosyltransferase involved in cell wall biosynthesis